MAGRNGIDTLSHAIVFVYVALFVINLFLNLDVLVYIGYVFFVLFLFRTLSKNLRARHRENAWFRSRLHTITSWFRRKPKKRKHTRKTDPRKKRKTQTQKQKKPDKNHVIRTCPVCHADLRVRNIKGERYVMCGSCKTEVKIKV